MIEMRINFNRPLMAATVWANIVKKLHEEYYAEQVEIPFKDWVYNKYEVKLLYTAHQGVNGIMSMEVPDDIAVYLELRFN